jgi:hypothetical protein
MRSDANKDAASGLPAGQLETWEGEGGASARASAAYMPSDASEARASMLIGASDTLPALA